MTTTSRIAGPAVTLDIDALRAWLQAPCPQHARAGYLGIDEDYSRGNGIDLLYGLETLLCALRDDDARTVWVLGPSVADIDIYRTFDGDSCDGALVLVDVTCAGTTRKLRLASLHQEFKDFASREEAGVDAAVSALTNVANVANDLLAFIQQTNSTRL